MFAIAKTSSEPLQGSNRCLQSSKKIFFHALKQSKRQSIPAAGRQRGRRPLALWASASHDSTSVSVSVQFCIQPWRNPSVIPGEAVAIQSLGAHKLSTELSAQLDLSKVLKMIFSQNALSGSEVKRWNVFRPPKNGVNVHDIPTVRTPLQFWILEPEQKSNKNTV